MRIELRSEIEKYFALYGAGAYSLSSITDTHPAWVIRKGRRYGVFVLYEGPDIYESFSGAMIRSTVLDIEGLGERNALVLSSDINELRNEFSLICEDFVNPGSNGEKREDLLNNPLNWWERWRELLGDSETNKMVYDIVGELWAVLKLYELKEEPYWSAAKVNSHDIELQNRAEAYEVKTTLKKDSATIRASSQFQFFSEKPLYLIFTRLEESLSGLSIDDLLERIEGYDSKHISEYNDYLESHQLGKGSHFRKQKYKILERNKYPVDESFPRITEEAFKGNRLPKGITHIEYSISLDGLSHENWR